MLDDDPLPPRRPPPFRSGSILLIVIVTPVVGAVGFVLMLLSRFQMGIFTPVGLMFAVAYWLSWRIYRDPETGQEHPGRAFLLAFGITLGWSLVGVAILAAACSSRS